MGNADPHGERGILVRKIDVQNFHRATRDTAREVNRRIILSLLRDQGPVSRAELARLMGAPRGMITSMVNELLEEGLVAEGATASTPRGRRPTLLHLRSHDRLAIGVDIRASRTAVQLCDFGGEPLECREFPTPDSPEEFVRALGRRVAELRRPAGEVGTLEGVGVVVPGMVDGRSGRVLNAPTLGWRDVDLQCALEDGTGLPVHIERDAVACAMARMWLGAHRQEGTGDFVYLIVSEGVGVGLVVNGQVVRGRSFTAGEFGHVPLDLDGPPCSCGGRGCLEAFVSDPATVARYLDPASTGRKAGSGRGEGIPRIGEIIALARAGDPAARHAVETTGRYLGVGLAAIVNALNPGLIVVGGEIVGAWDLLAPVIQAEVAARTLTAAAAATPIGIDPDHADTRLRGAAALVVAPAFAAPQIA
ncbi:MAG TPA: ROK family protein [Longimicrobiales bacterium]|nr:ROK family protein [Longimicrobiales bacterium]